MSESSQSCPKCDSGDIALIQYHPPMGVTGFFAYLLPPDPYIMKEEAATAESPGFHCSNCGYEWGENMWTSRLRNSSPSGEDT